MDVPEASMDVPEAKRSRSEEIPESKGATSDKHILRSWWGDRGEGNPESWTEVKYNEACEEWYQQNRTVLGMRDEVDCPYWGGSHCIEKCDDLYECHFVETILYGADPIEKCRVLKMLRGLHRSPEIPCIELPHGIVAVGLHAAQQYFTAYFDTPCELVNDGGNLELRFSILDVLGTAHGAIARSLTAYRDVATSPRVPLFQSLSPLPLFVKMKTDGIKIKGSSGGAAAGSSGIGDVLVAHYEENPSITLHEAIVTLRTFPELETAALEDPQSNALKREKQIYSEAEKLSEDDVDVASLIPKRDADRQKRLTSRRNFYVPSSSDMTRLFRRAGVEAECGTVLHEVRGIMKEFVQGMAKSAISLMEHRRSRVVSVDDVVASKPRGLTALGFGGEAGVRCVWSPYVQKVLKQVHPDLEIEPKAMSIMNDMSTFILKKTMLMARDFRQRQHRCKGAAPSDDEEGEDEDERAFWFKDVNAGASLCGGPGLSDKMQVRLYWERSYYSRHSRHPDLSTDGYDTLATPIPIITVREIQSAVRLLIGGEIAKHAVSEGTRAVTKYYARPRDVRGMGITTVLQFNPEHAALITERLLGNFPMSDGASVYVTAVIEYLNAEILELSGNAAKTERQLAINCRHVQLALINDDELNNLFPSCVLREGGVRPIIRAEQAEGTEPTLAFERVLVAKGQAAAAATGHACVVLVDPRTGLHMGVSTGDQLYPLPVLDAISRESQCERQQMAEAALSEEERAVMKAEGYCALHDDVEPEALGWARESLSALQRRRVNEIRYEQQSTSYIFPHTAFSRLAYEVGLDFIADIYYSAEALDCMQSLTEAYLIRLVRDAQLEAAHSRRLEIQPRDVQLSLQIGGGRS